MGVLLTPLIVKRVLTLAQLQGRSFAVDANNYLYQFLALIRKPDGTPLHDDLGRVTSHLAGLLYRTTRLLHDYDLRLVFVFDGPPPLLKATTLAKRRAAREEAQRAWETARAHGDAAAAFAKAVMTSRLTPAMIADAKRLLALLGIPAIQAPSEGEAQCAFLAQRGVVWAASSKDYDTLLFGAPRLLRFLTISGQEYLPSQGRTRPLRPELIELATLLAHHRLTRSQLIDLALLVGTDYNPGIKGIGPKTALTLIQTHHDLASLPPDLKAQLADQPINAIRAWYLHPEVIEEYDVTSTGLQEDALLDFLCAQRNFAPARVQIAIRRMQAVYARRPQTPLERWLPDPSS